MKQVILRKDSGAPADGSDYPMGFDKPKQWFIQAETLVSSS